MTTTTATTNQLLSSHHLPPPPASVFWRDSDECVLGTWSPFGLQLEAKG